MKTYEVQFTDSNKAHYYSTDVKVRAENMLDAVRKVVDKYPGREIKYVELEMPGPEVIE